LLDSIAFEFPYIVTEWFLYCGFFFFVNFVYFLRYKCIIGKFFGLNTFRIKYFLPSYLLWQYFSTKIRFWLYIFRLKCDSEIILFSKYIFWLKYCSDQIFSDILRAFHINKLIYSNVPVPMYRYLAKPIGNPIKWSCPKFDRNLVFNLS